MTDAVAQMCPINPVIDLVFSRWTTPILWVLERDGLVIRTYHAEIPPRVEYEISDLGRTLTPLFSAITDWSAAHLPACPPSVRHTTPPARKKKPGPKAEQTLSTRGHAPGQARRRMGMMTGHARTGGAS
ncbi:winged helix-turn-helix transcriptional regulator [Streptomyces nigrescens]